VPVEIEKRNCTLGTSFEGISLSPALFLPRPLQRILNKVEDSKDADSQNEEKRFAQCRRRRKSEIKQEKTRF
jgi:hypothetical protein